MKQIAFFTFFAVIIAVTGFAQANLQTVATVNLTRTENITVGQLRTEVEKFEKAAGRSLTADERRQVLDGMINERLTLQAAARDRITVTDNEVNQQMNQLRAQMAQVTGRQPTDAEFEAAIRNETGLGLPAFREQVQRQLTMQRYLLEKKRSTIENVRNPTDAEVLNAYTLARSQLVRPQTVRFSMIQVPFGADAASKNRARDLANRLVREIGTNPSRFDEVVVRGQAPNSGYQAGDGGYLPRNMEAARIVGQDFINAAFTLRQGQVSALIEGQIGFQIIKITEAYEQKLLELDDIFQLGTRITVREFITQGILQERQAAAVAQATEELVTELRANRGAFTIIDRHLNNW